MGQTVVEKIAEYNLADGPPDTPVRTGDFVSIWPSHVLTHDNSAAVMKKFKSLGVPRVRAPRQPVFALDHDVQNKSDANLEKYRSIEAFAKEHGIDFYPAGSGIGHQIMVENGYVCPGSFVVASDSHANMYGALGAVGTPIVRTDAAAVWATGQFWWQVPRTVKVTLEGTLPSWASGKDVILVLCGLYNKGEVLNAAVEFGGPGLKSLSMDARLTIANMTTEWGALVGWFPVDDIALEYIGDRCKDLSQQGVNRLTKTDMHEIRSESVMPDPDAVYAAEITLNLDQVSAHVSGPDFVQTTMSLGQAAEAEIKIDKAYLLSCVNSRLSDLRRAAEVLKNRKVADGVEFYVAAASKTIQEQAEAEGWWKVLIDAGARTLSPGCGPCIGLGEGLLEDGQVGISATNRNFKGRMGSAAASCYLASPAVVAASAVAGRVVGPDHWMGGEVDRAITLDGTPPLEDGGEVEIQEGFPASVSGRLVWIPMDNLNTDGIYGKDYTYREDMTPEDMAKVVMENLDPEFAGATEPGDVVVGGYNFGTGSSREQAATALLAKGFPMVIAGSYSQTYLRNAFNNGFICIESPDFVECLRKALDGTVPADRKFLVSGDEVKVDFATSTIRWREHTLSFTPLGRLPQSLVIAGGVENLIRRNPELV
jgi:homoaconitate hydratase